METNDQYLKNILEKVAKKCGIVKWNFRRKKINEVAMNFLGNIIPVSLIDESNYRTIHLMIKCAPDVPGIQETILVCYKRETYVYTTLFPVFKSLNTTILLDNLVPEYYYTGLTEDKILVLKDMNVIGFERYKAKYLDSDHINVSMKCIAKFHALSFIMKDRKTDLPNKEVLRPFTSDDSDGCYSVVEFFLLQCSPLFAGSQYEEFILKLQINFDYYLESSVHEARKTVYGHGDFWKENILFKYNEMKPVEACFVDFQMTRLMNPAYDVLFLLMSCAEINIEQKDFEEYLSIYYNTLRECLADNGLQMTYSEEDFTHDLKLVFPFCLIISFFSYSLWSGLVDLKMLATRKARPLEEIMRDEIGTTVRKMTEELISNYNSLGFN